MVDMVTLIRPKRRMADGHIASDLNDQAAQHMSHLWVVREQRKSYHFTPQIGLIIPVRHLQAVALDHSRRQTIAFLHTDPPKGV